MTSSKDANLDRMYSILDSFKQLQRKKRFHLRQRGANEQV